MDNWISTFFELPPEGVVVETKSEGGMEQDLKLVGKLWFFPDGGMYVYYTPRYWKHKSTSAKPSQP